MQRSILRDEDASALLSTTSATTFTTSLASDASVSASPTEAQAVAFTNKPYTVPLAVGLTLGLLALIVLIFGCRFYLLRRRRKTFPVPDAQPVSQHPVPPVMTQPAQSHSRSSWVRYDKRLAQPSRSSGVVMVQGDRPMSVDEAELGPPPSYDGRRHDESMDTA